ncbi:hypothetical protein EBU94_05425 [bacterium]|nr:hypothetical protein [bacterium]
MSSLKKSVKKKLEEDVKDLQRDLEESSPEPMKKEPMHKKQEHTGMSEYGTKEDVFDGKAKQTRSGKVRSDFILNKRGKVVDKARSMMAKERFAQNMEKIMSNLQPKAKTKTAKK